MLKNLLCCVCLAGTLIVGSYLTAQTPTESRGKIVYRQDSVLWSKTLPLGDPTEITGAGENPQWSSSSNWLSYDISSTGSDALYVRAMNPPYTVLNFKSDGEVHWSPTRDELAFVTKDGVMRLRPTAQAPHAPPEVVYHPEPATKVMSFCWSMDGNRLAVLTGDAQTQALWNVDAASAHAQKIPMEADVGSAKLAGWTQDAQRIVMWPNPEDSESAASDGLPVVAVSVASGSAQSFLKDPVLRFPGFVAFSPQRPDILVISGAFREAWTNKQLILANAAGGQTSALPSRKTAVASMAWSPDDELGAYSAGPDVGPVGGGDAAKKSAQPAPPLDCEDQWPASSPTDFGRRYHDEYPIWSKDGHYLVFTRVDTDGHVSVWGIDAAGGNAVKLVDSIMTGTRDSNAWLGDHGHVDWSRYVAWSR